MILFSSAPHKDLLAGVFLARVSPSITSPRSSLSIQRPSILGIKRAGSSIARAKTLRSTCLIPRYSLLEMR